MPRSALIPALLLALTATAGAQLTVDFTVSATTVAATEPVTFTGSATGVPTPALWTWDLGDGTVVPSAVPTLEHVYTTPGTYTVSLSVLAFPAGGMIVKDDLMTVVPPSLQPDFAASPSSGAAVLGVQFTDLTTGAGVPDAWLWNFGDGATSTEQNPFHTYFQPGNYTVSLAVFAGGEGFAFGEADAVVVSPASLEPDFTLTPSRGQVPLDVQFADATTGTGAPATWAWQFGDGSLGNGPTPSHTYDAPGTYSVSLKVFAGGQDWTALEPGVVVVDPAPLTPDFTAGPSSGSVGLAVQFQDTSTGVTPTSRTWDFGDGTTVADDSAPQHVYAAPGTYSVTLELQYFGQTETVVREDLIQVDHLATLHVPGDAPTIQAAIDLATPFTEILVGPGVWSEALTLGTQGVTIRGTAGAAQTVVDASGSDLPVVVADGTPAGTALHGLTLTGGRSPQGGGVHVGPDSRLALRECIVRGNESLGEGGGVWVSGTGAVVRVEDSTLRDNTAGTNGGALAIAELGVFSTSVAHVARCAVVDNVAGESGGGLSRGTARDCVLSGNHAGLNGGGAVATDVRRCAFVGNVAGVRGGGYHDTLVLMFGANFIDLEDCVFLDNVAVESGGGASVNAFSPFNGRVRVIRCVFAGNESPRGDGLRGYGEPGRTEVSQCTFVGDSVFAGEELWVAESVFRGTTEPFETSDVASVEWSNIEGGWPGPGNIDADPLFVDATADAYGLLPGSPCIDAGDPLQPFEPDGSARDIGALPLTAVHPVGVPLYGTLGLPSLEIDSTLTGGGPLSLELRRGPASGSATLVVGAAALSAPFKGGTLIPGPLVLLAGLPLDTAGALALDATWPAGLPTGATVWLQAWFVDAAGPAGFSSTAGVALVQP